jgi:hypothetical protein
VASCGEKLFGVAAMNALSDKAIKAATDIGKLVTINGGGGLSLFCRSGAAS